MSTVLLGEIPQPVTTYCLSVLTVKRKLLKLNHQAIYGFAFSGAGQNYKWPKQRETLIGSTFHLELTSGLAGLLMVNNPVPKIGSALCEAANNF